MQPPLSRQQRRALGRRKGGNSDLRGEFERGLALHRSGDPARAAVLYELVLRHDPSHFDALHLLGVAAVQTGRPERGAELIERAIGLQPGNAAAHVNLGRALYELKRPSDALSSFDQALALTADLPEAHSNRGLALRALGRFDQALASFDASIALSPGLAEAHNNRGMALRDMRQLAGAVASYEQAISLKASYAEPHNNLGIALRDLGRPGDALRSFDAAIALRADHADALANRASTLLLLGRFDEGWRQYEARWLKAARLPHRRPLWLGDEDLAGKTLLIDHEQGLGDAIQFCRYARMAVGRGARVILSAPPPLKTLMRSLGPGVEVVSTGDRAPPFDLHCPLMSLPRAFRTTLETIPSATPYLSADAPLRDEWRARLAPATGPRVGLVWSGSPTHKNDANRSIPFAALAPLLAADVQWMSLQKDMRPADVEAFVASGRVTPCPALSDFSDTAAMVELMDLVITVDTSVAHLAGALGKPVWVLLPYDPDWRWLLGRSDSPWYPSARLFRQASPGDWTGVLEQVAATLAKRMG